MSVDDVVDYLSHEVNLDDPFGDVVRTAPVRQYDPNAFTSYDAAKECGYDTAGNVAMNEHEKAMLQTALDMNASRALTDLHLKAMHEAHPSMPMHSAAAR